MSFHIISPNPAGRELSSKKSPQGHSFPVHPIPPSNMCSHWPTSNKEAEGAAQVMHMQQGKWMYFHLYCLHNTVNLYFEGLADKLLSKVK